MSEQDILNEVGQRIRYYRKLAKMTQYELADKTHVGRTSITNIELGMQDTTVTTLQAIATALNVPIRDLFPSNSHLPFDEIES